MNRKKELLIFFLFPEFVAIATLLIHQSSASLWEGEDVFTPRHLHSKIAGSGIYLKSWSL